MITALTTIIKWVLCVRAKRFSILNLNISCFCPPEILLLLIKSLIKLSLDLVILDDSCDRRLLMTISYSLLLKSTGHVQVNNNKVFGTCGSVFCLHMKS